MQKYELVLLLNSSISEKDRQDTISMIENTIKDCILETDEMGLRTTTYDFGGKRGNDKFFFYSYFINASSDVLDALKKQLLYNKVVSRYFIYKMSATQEFFKFDEVNKTLQKVVEDLNDKKTGQKLSFLREKDNKKYINRKCIPILKKYTTRFGDIKPRKYTNNQVLVQKALKQAVSRARELGMLDYIK